MEVLLPEVEENPEEVTEVGEVASELEEIVTEVGVAKLLDGFLEAEVRLETTVVPLGMPEDGTVETKVFVDALDEAVEEQSELRGAVPLRVTVDPEMTGWLDETEWLEARVELDSTPVDETKVLEDELMTMLGEATEVLVCCWLEEPLELEGVTE